MPTESRHNPFAAARRLVVKIGTRLLAATPPPSKSSSEGAGHGAGIAMNRPFIEDLARQVAQLRHDGCEVTLVSSGAIACGCIELGMARRPTDLAALQAVAAVGQRRLMGYMHEAFAKHGLHVGQVLLTRGDFDDRLRFLNIRNCITHLHKIGCVPILNENDTVAIDEIRFGDNDLLAALTCNALRADALMLLTTVPGLLDAQGRVVEMMGDPASMNAAAGASEGKMSLPKPANLTETGAGNRWSSGGMASKIEAARLVADAGEPAVIASGMETDVLGRLLAGEKLGTLFVPAARKLNSRSRWIGLTARPTGTLTIDDGAVTALRKGGKSLLATGVTKVTGRFGRGAVVVIRDAAGREIARGLTNYPDDELTRIMGKRSSQFEKVLGRPAYTEIIHRDNLVVRKSDE